jgi:hypothetical protein
VNPDPVRGYEGLCWGVDHTEAFSNGSGDASNVRALLAPLMPQPGEDASSVSDVSANVYGHCIELMAGQAAERMLLVMITPGLRSMISGRRVSWPCCSAKAREQSRRSLRTAMSPRGIC